MLKRPIVWAVWRPTHCGARAPAEAVGLAYEQSYSVAAYLVDRYAFWRVRRLLLALGEGQSFEEALAGEMHVKLEKLEAAWLEWLPTLLEKAPAR